ncbi:MAG: beta-ketoacyl-ACP synthase III [Candidatus Margulisiibacteriota bacterium]
MLSNKAPIGLLGVGHYLPHQCISNEHFVDRGLDTTPDWIETRSGIQQRHIANKDELTSDLSVKAAQMALETAGISIEDIDFIIVATASPDHSGFPSTACIVQKKLNGKRHIPCFDITAACSGFTYGLSIAYGYIQSGIGTHGLVIGAECLSRLVDWSDRRSAILFGDGAGAAVVGPVNSGGILAFDQGADGHASDILKCELSENIEDFSQRVRAGFTPTIHMDGRAVFKKGVEIVSKSIETLLTQSKLTADDISFFVCHQANVRILESVAKRVGVPIDRFLTNIDRVGNTSAASIPIVLSEFSKQSKFTPGDRVCLVGFGAGFTWSSIILEWSNYYESN